MDVDELRVALERDIWKASVDQLLVVAGVLGWDVKNLVENLTTEES